MKIFRIGQRKKSGKPSNSQQVQVRQEVLDALENRDKARLIYYIERLGSEPSLETLNLFCEILEKGSIPDQSLVIEKLSNWTSYREQVAERLIQHFRTDTREATRISICQALPRLMKPDKVYPVLLDILRKEDSLMICLTIAKALQSIAPRIKDQLIQVLLNEEDPKMVRYCVMALSELPEVSDEMIQRLEKESEPERKSHLCYLLWHFRPVKAVPLLLKLGTDPDEDWLVRFKAISALDIIVKYHHAELELDEIVQTIIAKLTEPDKGMEKVLKRMMISVLGSTGTEKANQFIERYIMESDDPELIDFVQRFIRNE